MTDFTFIPGESFNGAIARWADEVGGVESMIEITSHAGVVYNHRQNAPSASPDQIDALAIAMDVDARELHTRATPRMEPDPTSRYDRHMVHGVAIPIYLIEKRIRRFSPRGLSQGARRPEYRLRLRSRGLAHPSLPLLHRDMGDTPRQMSILREAAGLAAYARH